MPGVKYFFAMAIPILLKTVSMLEECLLLPMNTLKFPSSELDSVPTTSLSTSWISSSMEKDCATAPYMIWLSGLGRG